MTPPAPEITSLTPIRLDNLSVRFGQQVALSQLSYSFQPGQCYAVMGQSGCGKSTVLRTICGLVLPTAGCVWFGDQRADPQNMLWLRRRIGYVIQEVGLFPHLTAWKNVTLMARHLRWERDRIEQRVGELSEMTELTPDQLSRYPAELSGGQRQRVGLMRALMLDPEVLLLDEPLGALDPIHRRRLQDDLKRIFASLGKTVILATHDLAEADYLSDQLLLMSEGRVVQAGDLDQLRRAPASAFVTEFVNAHRPLEREDGRP